MKTAIYLSPRVLNTINALPENDRIAVASAIAGELILGDDDNSHLTPMQTLAFTIIRSYVKSDTSKLERAIG
ncbi:MAG: hypothetical protein NC102_08180 [Clostridium sp.]|nr:hypothetical protein [Clostridium sp.]